jgi:xylulose-5-phosphate/fructose-6-phosphate phosphoketolase
MCVRNTTDRFHLAMDVINRVPALAGVSGHLLQTLQDKLIDHSLYIREHGEDMPEIAEWQWPAAKISG